MGNYGFQEVVNMINKTKNLCQLTMQVVTSLRKPNYNDLHRFFFFHVARSPDQHFYHSALSLAWWFFVCVTLWWVDGCWSLGINGIAFPHIISLFWKEGLEKSQILSQPHLSFFVIKTKLFQNYPIESWNKWHPLL